MANKYEHLAPKKQINLEENLKSWSRCLGKKFYSCEESARRQAKFVFKQYQAVQDPYKCPHCLLFHLKSRRKDSSPSHNIGVSFEIPSFNSERSSRSS